MVTSAVRKSAPIWPASALLVAPSMMSFPSRNRWKAEGGWGFPRHLPGGALRVRLVLGSQIPGS